MFEFDQYLGFLAFLTILTIGFWLMIFLLTFVVPYWIGGSIMEMIKEKRAAKKAKQESIKKGPDGHRDFFLSIGDLNSSILQNRNLLHLLHAFYPAFLFLFAY